MNCPQCNAPTIDKARFCENCGALLPSTAASTPTPASPYDSASTPSAPTYATPISASSAPVPPSPYDDAARGGKHASASGDITRSGSFIAGFAGAAAESIDIAKSMAQPKPPTSEATRSSSIGGGKDPYAAAVNAAGSSSTSFGQAQPTYAQPTYAEPASYAQPTYAQPANPYATAVDTAPAGAFGLAIASLVIGIIGLLTFGIGGIFGFLGIIFGIIAIVVRSGYKKKGLYDSRAGSTMGLAIAGIVTNVLAIMIFIMLIFIGMTVADESYEYDFSDEPSIEQLLGEENA